MDIKRYYRKTGLTDPSYMVVRQATPVLVKAMADHLRGRILDIGCGEKSKELLADSDITEYVGLDHEQSLHDQTKVDIFGTAYAIPEPGESFDGVLCTAVLEHLEAPLDALREAYRVLKKGGTAIYTAPFFWHLHEEPRDFYRYTKFGLSYLFQTAGFEIVEIRALSGFWLTVGTEASYYVKAAGRGPLKPVVPLAVAIANLIFPLLHRIDARIPAHSEKWTWSYLVVAKKR